MPALRCKTEPSAGFRILKADAAAQDPAAPAEAGQSPGSTGPSSAVRAHWPLTAAASSPTPAEVWMQLAEIWRIFEI